MFKKITLLASMFLLILSASGYSATSISTREEYSLATEISSINLSGYNGSIIWFPIDSAAESHIVVETEVRGSVASSMESFLKSIPIDYNSYGSKVSLRAERLDHPPGVMSSTVHFTVYASPEQIFDFQAQTSNGSINIHAEFQGSLNLVTSNGPITLQSGRGVIDLETSNGPINLGNISLAGSSSVRTSNGRIKGTVELPSTGQYVFKTSNGSINLQMPHDTTGTFDVKTSNAVIEFRLGQDIITSRKSIYIRRGEEPTIVIKTSNGKVSVGEGDIN